MTQFNSAGFSDLRTYLQNNWAFIGVNDDTGTEQIRWDANNNTNVSWTSGPSGNPLTAELTVTGQDIVDAGGSLPVTLSDTDAYKSSSASTSMGSDSLRDSTGTATTATLEATGDEVVITHNYEMPPQ